MIYITTFIFILLVILGLPTDDTDKSFLKRSGMTLYIDYRTGLQYLANDGLFTKGSLIPRLDENGNHMRIKQ